MCLRCEAREVEEARKIWGSWVRRRGARVVRESEGGVGRAERTEGMMVECGGAGRAAGGVRGAGEGVVDRGGRGDER